MFRSVFRRSCLALLAMLVSSNSILAGGSVFGQDTPGGSTTHRDLVFATAGQRELKLDLYLPASASMKQPAPLVVWVHGGGWKAGGRSQGGPARALVREGFAVADVDYRLSQEAIFPAQIQDCKAAIRWLRINPQGFPIATDKIGAWGSSAGGHLVAMLGTTGDSTDWHDEPALMLPKELEGKAKQSSSRVQAVCDWYGPTELLSMNRQAIPGSRLDHDAKNSPESQLVGGPIQVQPFRALAKKASPLTYVTAGDAPFLIMHGKNDLLVSYRQSETFHAALRKAGVSSELVLLPNVGHGFRRQTRTLLPQVTEFFNKQLK